MVELEAWLGIALVIVFILVVVWKYKKQLCALIGCFAFVNFVTSLGFGEKVNTVFVVCTLVAAIVMMQWMSPPSKPKPPPETDISYYLYVDQRCDPELTAAWSRYSTLDLANFHRVDVSIGNNAASAHAKRIHIFPTVVEVHGTNELVRSEGGSADDVHSFMMDRFSRLEMCRVMKVNMRLFMDNLHLIFNQRSCSSPY